MAIRQDTLSAPDSKNSHVAVLDIETTGRKPSNGTIVEIGVCLLDLSNGKVKKLFDSIVQEPDLYTRHESSSLKDSWVFNNSDLTLEAVKASPQLLSFKEELQNIFSTYWITAYNKDFDLGFLKSRGFSFPKQGPCPMKAATPLLKLNYSRRYHSYKWPTVEEAWDYFFPDKNYYEAHRAYDDAVHEAQIVYALYQRGKWKI